MFSINRLNKFKFFFDAFLKRLPLRRELISFKKSPLQNKVQRTPCLLTFNDKWVHFSTHTNLDKKNWEKISSEEYCRSLWSKQTNLFKDQKESNRFNIQEFKILINELKHAILYSKPKCKLALKNEFKTLVKIFSIRDSNFQIGNKLSIDSNNWAIVVNILDDLLRIESGKINRDNNLLLDPFMNSLMSLIAELQTEMEENVSYQHNLKSSKTQNESGLYFRLIHSYFEYLRRSKKEIQDSVYLYLLKSYSNYLISISKTSGTDFILLCKIDKEFLKHYTNFDKYLELFMRKYPNFYLLSNELKEDFFEFFSFNHKKWSNSLQLIQNDANLRATKVVYHSIIGSIRFDDNVKFKWLTGLLKHSNFEKFSGLEFQNYIDEFSITFLRAKIKYVNNLEENLEVLLDTWNLLNHWPGMQVVEELNRYINEINHTKVDRDKAIRKIKISNIQVNYKGACSNGHKLPIKTYDNQALRTMAEELRKTKLPSPFKELFHKSLDKLKNLLKNEKFDYVIDAMNIIYLSNRFQIDNLHSLLQLLDKNKTKLMILKEHMMKNDSELRKIQKTHSNVKFVYFNDRLPDDRFILYATMLCGNNSFVVSNDNYHDTLFEMQEYRALFKSWLINRRIVCHHFLNKLYYPPLFNVNVNKVEENAWFVPYLNEKRESPFHEPKSFLFINRTF